MRLVARWSTHSSMWEIGLSVKWWTWMLWWMPFRRKSLAMLGRHNVSRGLVMINRPSTSSTLVNSPSKQCSKMHLQNKTWFTKSLWGFNRERRTLKIGSWSRDSSLSICMSAPSLISKRRNRSSMSPLCNHLLLMSLKIRRVARTVGMSSST